MTDDSTGARLPPAARDRMAEIRGSGTWGSALSTDEFAAIRGVGFEPVGQVLGACVYNIGYAGGYTCPGGWSSGVFGGVVTAATQVSGQGGWGTFGPLTQAMYDARRKAIGRMTAECAALGGHGIVGVSLSFGPFPLGGLEFRAIGTAVRGKGAPAPPQPFSSHLSGQDFAKLIRAGWVPVDDWQTRGAAFLGAGNTEVAGYTELVNLARHDARVQLEADVSQMGAEGVVVSTYDLRVRARECPMREGSRDHVAEVTIVGTATAQFSSPAVAAPPGSLAVLSLDPQRRQVARVRLGR